MAHAMGASLELNTVQLFARLVGLGVPSSRLDGMNDGLCDCARRGQRPAVHMFDFIFIAFCTIDGESGRGASFELSDIATAARRPSK